MLTIWGVCIVPVSMFRAFKYEQRKMICVCVNLGLKGEAEWGKTEGVAS
jgi:hypothetical protein